MLKENINAKKEAVEHNSQDNTGGKEAEEPS